MSARPHAAIRHALGIVLLAVLWIAALPPRPAEAQAFGEGVLGWEDAATAAYYGSASAACRARWDFYDPHNDLNRYIGTIKSDNPDIVGCLWTTAAYLCPEENDVIEWLCAMPGPAAVYFRCASGYAREGNGRCVPVNEPEGAQGGTCSGENNGGNETQRVGKNPIELRTGAKLTFSEDFATDDGRFRIARLYRSIPVGASSSVVQLPLGLATGWQFSFAMELQLGRFARSFPSSNPDADVTLIPPGLEGHDFRLLSNGTWVADGGNGYPTTDYKLEFLGTLPADLADVKTASTMWRVTDNQSRVWTLKTFQNTNFKNDDYFVARPTQIKNKDGYTLTLIYADDGRLLSIVDSFGRTATFAWNIFHTTSIVPPPADALPYPEAVSEITFPDGTKVRYFYDPPPTLNEDGASTTTIERLVETHRLSATNTELERTTYHYEDTRFQNYLTGITDSRNIRVATYAYDARGRGVSTEGANGTDKYTVTYTDTATHATRDVLNPLGRTTKYVFQRFDNSPPDVRIVSVEGLPTPNCPATARSYTYDANKFIASKTDDEGRVTTFVRDALGRPTSITEADGTPEENTTTIVWHPTLNYPDMITEPGLTTELTYNPVNNRLVRVTQTDTTTHTVPYPTNGQTRVWAATYTTAAGLVRTIDGPLAGTGDTITFGYDSAGYLASVTDQLGHVTEIDSVNGRGQPTAITDPNGKAYSLAYDDLGRLTLVTENIGTGTRETALAYNAVGDITRITRPDGSFLNYTYDGARRVTVVANNAGEKLEYFYDLMGGVTARRVKNSAGAVVESQTRTFDELGRLLSLIGASAQTWTFGYDKVDNLLSVEDPRENVFGYGYDALNRLITLTDEDDAATELTRSLAGDVIAHEDPNAVVTSYVRNGWGEAIREESPDIGITDYVRDARGLVTQMTDGRGSSRNMPMTMRGG